MSERMTYAEHAPHPALARHVDCYWMARFVVPPGEMGSSTVLPDGCMDILFNLAQPAEATTDPYVVGAMTRPMHMTNRGVTNLVGVRFKPAGSTPYLDLAASDITNGVASLGALWGPGAAEVCERLQEAPDTASRIAVLDDVLTSRLRRSASRADPRALAASELVSHHEGRISIEGLAEATSLSRRQLERRFLAAVGTTPKVAARIARFQGAVSRLHRDRNASLAHVALDCGYADQAHLTREFTALAGQPPGTYRASIL